MSVPFRSCTFVLTRSYIEFLKHLYIKELKHSRLSHKFLLSDEFHIPEIGHLNCSAGSFASKIIELIG